MAARWQDAAAQQAELAADRLREFLSAGLGVLRSEFGLELGIEPRQYPSWVVLLTAVLGLLVIGAVWAAACAGICARRKRAGSDRLLAAGSSEGKVPPGRGQRVDDAKKKQKKKPADKSKSNGRVELPEDEVVPVTQKETLKQPFESDKKTEKVKKNKKKSKSDLKQGYDAASSDRKEADEGAWEKKVSNREKRQQRKREKVVEPGVLDSSIPGLEVTTVAATEQVLSTAPISVAPRKSRGESSQTNQFSSVKSGKEDAILSQVSSGWNETPSVNGGSWAELPGKRQSQIGCEEKWTTVQPAAAGKRKTEPCTWGPDAGDANGASTDWPVPIRAKTWGQHSLFPSIDPWPSVDGRMNTTEQGPSSFSTLGLNPPVSGSTSEPAPQPSVSDHQWDTAATSAPIDDEWSGLNGLSSVDPSSDWNAPSEEWGHWVEEEAAPPPQPEEPVMAEVQKISDDEKEKVESTQQGSTSGKSKKKKKKKKKHGEDASSVAQETVEPEIETLSELQEDPSQVEPKQEMFLPVETISAMDEEEEPEEEANPVSVVTELSDTVSSSPPQKVISQVPQRLSEPETSISIAKQNSVPPPLQTKSEDLESLKQVKKKKKARRET